MKNREFRYFIAILILGSVIRAGYAFMTKGITYNDTSLYMSFAEHISNTGTYSAIDKDGLEVRSFRPPLFPLLLSLFIKNGTFRKGQFIFLQILLSLLCSFFVFLSVKRLTGGKLALPAALFSVLYPPLVYYPSTLITEMLFTALFTAGFFFLIKREQGSYVSNSAVSAVFFALSCYVKSMMLLFPGVIAVEALIMKKPVKGTLVFLSVFFAVLAPWSIRNTIVLKRFVPMSTEGGITLYWENHKGSSPGKGYRAPDNFDLEAYKGLSETGRSDYYLNLGKEFIINNPGRFIALCLGRAWQFLKPAPNRDLSVNSGLKEELSRAVFFVFYLPLFIALVLSLFICRKPELLILHLAFLYFLGIYSVVAGKTRYRFPLEPMMIVNAFVFIQMYLERRKKTARNR